MWTRAELKERGRKVFMGNYWTTVGCILAILAISAGASGLVSKIAPMGSLIVSILVAYPLTVSMSKFLLDNREGKASSNDIFYGFTAGYGNVILNMFMMNLFIALWSLLLIVPGIVKAYSYRMVPFLVAERPEIDYKEALDTSRMMRDGEKMNAFVLDLSFLGWMLLTALTCGILGVFYTVPYMSQTNAELYVTLKAKLDTPVADFQQM